MFPLTDECLDQRRGHADVVAVAFDANGNSLAYTTSLGLTSPPAGQGQGVVLAAWRTDFNTAVATTSNTPANVASLVISVQPFAGNLAFHNSSAHVTPTFGDGHVDPLLLEKGASTRTRRPWA